jgi:hypothetical protein
MRETSYSKCQSHLHSDVRSQFRGHLLQMAVIYIRFESYTLSKRIWRDSKHLAEDLELHRGAVQDGPITCGRGRLVRQ